MIKRHFVGFRWIDERVICVVFVSHTSGFERRFGVKVEKGVVFKWRNV